MTSIINASTTGAGGVSIASDASGVLALQAGGVTAATFTGATTALAGSLTAVTTYETKLSPAIAAGVLTLNTAGATVFDVSMSGNITSLLFTNLPASGVVYSFTLILTYTGSVYTASWPASFKWPYSSPPALSSTNGKQDVFAFLTRDAGTTWLAFVSGQNL